MCAPSSNQYWRYGNRAILRSPIHTTHSEFYSVAIVLRLIVDYALFLHSNSSHEPGDFESCSLHVYVESWVRCLLMYCPYNIIHITYRGIFCEHTHTQLAIGAFVFVIPSTTVVIANKRSSSCVFCCWCSTSATQWSPMGKCTMSRESTWWKEWFVCGKRQQINNKANLKNWNLFFRWARETKMIQTHTPFYLTFLLTLLMFIVSFLYVRTQKKT